VAAGWDTGIRPTVVSAMGKAGVAREAGQPEEAPWPDTGSVDPDRRRRRRAFVPGIGRAWPPMAALGSQAKAVAADGMTADGVAADGVAAGAAAAESEAEARRRDVPSWLAQVGMFTMVGVGIGVAAEGLPAGIARLATVGLLIAASAAWGVALSGRVRDLRVLVPTLIALGLCGAALDLLQSDGPGFVVGYMALSGLALRAPGGWPCWPAHRWFWRSRSPLRAAGFLPRVRVTPPGGGEGPAECLVRIGPAPGRPAAGKGRARPRPHCPASAARPPWLVPRR
jgi:hypothetical protein